MTITTEQLLELAAKCEAVSGPDRSIDLAIALAFGRRAYNGSINISHHYTASLDAAMSLVPAGCWAEGSLSSPAALEVHAPMTFDPLGKGFAATPALALVSAAIRAIARARVPASDEGGL